MGDGPEFHDSRMGFAVAFDGRLIRTTATRASRCASEACAYRVLFSQVMRVRGLLPGGLDVLEGFGCVQAGRVV